MNTHNNLVTTYSFRGKEYLVNLSSMKNLSGSIEIKVTDKKTLEEWQGSYEASYIESLTQKTGNYKRFDTFISMFKSALLKTSQCVTLDLLTFDDLEMLRSRRTHSRIYSSQNSSQILGPPSNNRRYLIVTYTVEFDRIHYPLAMEYCGPPDPRVLQETIQRLEKQVLDLQNQLNGSNWDDVKYQIDLLQKKVIDVTSENIFLKEQSKKFNCLPKSRLSCKETDMLLRSIHSLENRLMTENGNVELLKRENSQLTLQLDQVLKSEKNLRAQLNSLQFESHPIHIEQKPQKPFYFSFPNRNKSLENINTDKPFCRNGHKPISSARSFLNLARSSSEDSLVGEKYKKPLKKSFQFKLSSRSRTSSPSFSDLSHNSGLSRCACRNCLRSKYTKKETQPSGVELKKKEKRLGKAKILKRIQSLEKLINGIVLS